MIISFLVGYSSANNRNKATIKIIGVLMPCYGSDNYGDAMCMSAERDSVMPQHPSHFVQHHVERLCAMHGAMVRRLKRLNASDSAIEQHALPGHVLQQSICRHTFLSSFANEARPQIL